MTQYFLPISTHLHQLNNLEISAQVPDLRVAQMHQQLAKARCSWYLHELTKSVNLSLIVCYASIVGSIGSIGQSAYCAANRFLDGLIEHRNRNGFACLSASIRWPAIRGVGMAAAAESSGHMS